MIGESASEDDAAHEEIMGPAEGPCDVCGDQDASYPGKCERCGTAVCEACEIMKCDDGYHACPKCDAKMGSCGPLLRDD